MKFKKFTRGFSFVCGAIHKSDASVDIFYVFEGNGDNKFSNFGLELPQPKHFIVAVVVKKESPSHSELAPLIYFAAAMDEFDNDGIVRFDTPSSVLAASTAKLSLSIPNDTSHNRGKLSSQDLHRVTNKYQKENQVNTTQEITWNVVHKNDDIRMGRSLSKVQSLSSIRDIGCTNPMAYTLWHHPTLNENYSTKQGEGSTADTTSHSKNLNHDDAWTIHENWDLLNQLDSTEYASKLIATTATFNSAGSPVDEGNDFEIYDNSNNNDDDEDDWNSAMFVPVTTTMTGGVTATRTVAWMNDATTAVSAASMSTLTNTTRHRRHSLPEYIPRPIAVRPLSTSSSSSSGLHNLIK